jgi:hypothetical protein
MKILMIECNAEEIKANRTIFDGVADAINQFCSNMSNAGITPEMVAALNGEDCEDEESDD